MPIRLAFDLPPHPLGYTVLNMAWQVSTVGEEVGNTANNRRTANVYYCDSNATSEHCT